MKFINQIFSLFEGANEPTFIDAVPLYLFKEEINTNYIEIKSKVPFKYLRFLSPLKTKNIISNLEVFGYKQESDIQNEEGLYQPTNIPLIVVNPEGKINLKSKSKDADCNFIIIENGKITVKQTGTIRIRGNSSKDLEKKSFQINLDKKTKILVFV